MKTTQQQKDNKLIAKFMGLTIITDGISYFDTDYKPLKNYHSDWNWLMEVVEKIEKTVITETYGQFNENKVDAIVSVSIENTFCQILSNGLYLNEIVSIDGETKIQAVYDACLEFIKYYNENT